MKLRIRGNSLRLRLTQPEVAAVASGARVEEHVAFGGANAFTYVFEGGDCAAVEASFDGRAMVVRAPIAAVRAWALGDDVALRGSQDAGGGERLQLLVEKDFACLKEREGEDDAGAFANPKATC